VTTSIGAAFYPADGDTAEELLGTADRRMYFQKHNYYGILAAPDELPFEMADFR
jgi:GGDEF domain-containing protein